MEKTDRKILRNIQPLLIFAFIAIFFVGITSCSKEVKDPVTMVYDPEIVPSVGTDSAILLYSDSGVVRYKLIANRWEIFEKAKEPYHFYPKGVYVEQYDSAFNVIATLRADTAWNYTRKKVWELRGKVRMNNVKGETFSSEELFYDQNKDRVYSNKYVVIHQPDKITLRAEGFESNQNMTYYKFTRATKTDIFIDENEEQAEEKTE